MLNCYFGEQGTTTLHGQKASQTLVSAALQRHTELEALLPLFWVSAYLGEISPFWPFAMLNDLLSGFYGWDRLLLT